MRICTKISIKQNRHNFLSVSTHAIQENTCSYHFIRLENNEYAIHESSSVDHFKYNIYCAIVH